MATLASVLVKENNAPTHLMFYQVTNYNVFLYDIDMCYLSPGRLTSNDLKIVLNAIWDARHKWYIQDWSGARNQA